ncbi:MAG: protein kinase, partial [Pirellulaceae bacterium]|nr:protein kinase [Pirellulaceae bacterium]
MENLSEKDERDPIELMADEFLDRRRNGDDVTIEEYEQKHPDSAEEIREVLNAMLAMEDFKPRHETLTPRTPFDEMATGKIRQLGEFRILRKIAHGGMGVVYEAEEKSLGRRVAIKVLANHLLSEKSTVERFHREAKAIANLHHTNIVSVFGAGFEKDLHFYVMQYVDGISLEQMIKSGEVQRKFKNNWKWITEVVRRVALALRQAHLRDILHR